MNAKKNVQKYAARQFAGVSHDDLSAWSAQSEAQGPGNPTRWEYHPANWYIVSLLRPFAWPMINIALKSFWLSIKVIKKFDVTIYYYTYQRTVGLLCINQAILTSARVIRSQNIYNWIFTSVTLSGYPSFANKSFDLCQGQSSSGLVTSAHWCLCFLTGHYCQGFITRYN